MDVDQLQDSIGDWLQVTELLLVTSFAISLPGIGSLPGPDPADNLYELIVGQCCLKSIISKIIFPNKVETLIIIAAPATRLSCCHQVMCPLSLNVMSGTSALRTLILIMGFLFVQILIN